MHIAASKAVRLSRLCATIIPALIALSGCAAIFQNSSEALIRDPGDIFYGPPKPVSEVASRYWEYATIASLAYPNDGLMDKSACAEAFVPGVKSATLVLPSGGDVQSLADANYSAIVDALENREGWRKWDGFPNPSLEATMEAIDLFASVWERRTNDRTTVVVAFKGTNPRKRFDWLANFRWLWMWLPGYADQYDMVVRDFEPAFIAEYKKREADVPAGKKKIIYAAGHSLGGGLAHQFAYALPLDDAVPRISRVYAFDSSPVTGYYSVPKETRETNAHGEPDEKHGMEIGRIFEKGEILSYLRGLIGLVYVPSDADPAIAGVRFNLFPSLNPIASHNMDELACKLYEKASGAGTPRHFDPEGERVQGNSTF